MNYTVFCAMCAAQIKVYETQVEILNVARQVIKDKFNDKVLNARLPKAIEGEVKRAHPTQNVIVRLDWDNYNGVALTVYDGENRAYRTSDPDKNGYYTTGYVTDDTAKAVITIDKDTQRVNAPATVENIIATQLQLLDKVDEVRRDMRQYDEVRQAAAKLQAAIANYRKQYSHRLRYLVPGCNL